MYCSEYFNVFEWLIWASHEIKKVGGIKKEKLSPLKHFIWQETIMKMTISVGRWLKRKTMLVWVKQYLNKNFATFKSLCNLQELYTAFKEKYRKVNIGFSKFCALRLKWCILAGPKMTHSICVYSAHQNVVLLVGVMDWDLTYKDLIKLILSSLKYFH